MSDPTYRIDVSHTPEDRSFQWKAQVWRLSDNQLVAVRVGDTAEQVASEAQETVSAMTAAAQGFTLLVDDDGRPVEGHSVKACDRIRSAT